MWATRPPLPLTQAQAPLCHICGRKCTLDSTRSGNNGNYGRPRWACEGFGHFKFSTFNDFTGITQGNPLCDCNYTSRRQKNYQDQSEFYRCPIGRCYWKQQHPTPGVTVGMNRIPSGESSESFHGATQPHSNPYSSVSQYSTPNWTIQSTPQAHVSSIGSQSTYPEVFQSSRPAPVPSDTYRHHTDTTSPKAHFAPPITTRVPQYETESGGRCCHCCSVM